LILSVFLAVLFSLLTIFVNELYWIINTIVTVATISFLYFGRYEKKYSNIVYPTDLSGVKHTVLKFYPELSLPKYLWTQRGERIFKRIFLFEVIYFLIGYLYLFLYVGYPRHFEIYALIFIVIVLPALSGIFVLVVNKDDYFFSEISLHKLKCNLELQKLYKPEIKSPPPVSFGLNKVKTNSNKTNEDKPLVFGMSMLKPPRTDDPYLVVNNIINVKEVSMSNSKVEDDFVSSSDGQKLHSELVKFQSSIGGLPTIPTHSLEYEGWFKEVKKGIARKKEQQSLAEHTETIKRFSALHEEYLGLMKKYVSAQETKNEMILAKEKEKLIPLQIDVEKTKLAADKSDHELKIAQNQAEIAKLQNPKQSQPSIREQKEEELWLVQIQAQIDNIKNRPPKPEITDPIIRKLEKIREYETKKEEMINEAKTEPEKSRVKKMFNNEIGRVMEGS